jgi:surface antigen
MNRLRTVAAALALAAAALPLHLPAALADAPAVASLAQLNQQLSDDQARLNDLNDQVERAQGSLDMLNRKLTDDRQREADLDRQLVAMGRLEYEQPAFSLSTVLEARSLNQLLTDIAQARLVAHKQGSLLGQARQLRQQDEQARNQMAADLARVQTARDDAARVASQTQALRDSAQDAALRARADAVAQQARATQAPPQTVSPPPGGSYPNHFAYGYCTYYVATRRPIPWFGNAIDWWPNARAYGFPEGPTPRVGAVMVTRESAVGHVAFVESVSGSSWTVSEMNYVAWNVVDRRTLVPGQTSVVGFIYG